MLGVVLMVVATGACAVAVAATVERHRTAERLRALALRLDPHADVAGSSSLAQVLAATSRAVEVVRSRVVDDDDDADRLMQMLDELPVGVVVADELGEVVARNAIADRFAEARHAAAIVEAAVVELLEEALGGEGVEREIELFGPPREVVQLRAAPLGRQGSQIGAFVLIRDLTEIRRVEQVRRDFVANVSHELKTPVGALTVLTDALDGEDDPEVRARLVQRVGAEAERLGRIVHDLLDLSVIEGMEVRHREPERVDEPVAAAAERVTGAAAAADIEVVAGPFDHDLAVPCDRRHVVSALFNLLDNAVKYSDPGAKVEVGADVEGDDLHLWVRDHGVGIPAPDRERIFERFYRVDRARHRRTGGTGLGLSIVRHVAEAHGGRVAVASEEGIGSTFSLWLPLGIPRRRDS